MRRSASSPDTWQNSQGHQAGPIGCQHVFAFSMIAAELTTANKLLAGHTPLRSDHLCWKLPGESFDVLRRRLVYTLGVTVHVPPAHDNHVTENCALRAETGETERRVARKRTSTQCALSTASGLRYCRRGSWRTSRSSCRQPRAQPCQSRRPCSS